MNKVWINSNCEILYRMFAWDEQYLFTLTRKIDLGNTGYISFIDQENFVHGVS